jgi:hypothetical protein
MIKSVPRFWLEECLISLMTIACISKRLEPDESAQTFLLCILFFVVHRASKAKFVFEPIWLAACHLNGMAD